MRLAPAVATTASNAGAWRAGQVLLLALVASVTAVWALLQMGSSGIALWIGVVAAGGCAAIIAWRRVPHGEARLGWTGASWQIETPGRPGPVELRGVEVALDLGSALLLHLHPVDPNARQVPRWLLVTRREAGPDFRALCIALYAEAPAERWPDPGLAPRPGG